jgi:hypothetical protein
MTIIEYPGTRVFKEFLNYSNNRVIGSSTRVQWMQIIVITQHKTDDINQRHYFEV